MLSAVVLVGCGSQDVGPSHSHQPENAERLTPENVKMAVSDLATDSPAPPENVDVPSLARSIALQLPLEYSDGDVRTAAQRRAVLDRAVAAYRRMEAARGATETLKALYDTEFQHAGERRVPQPEVSPDGEAIWPLLIGWDFLGVLFPEGGSLFLDWRIQSISIVGTSTARVQWTAKRTADTDESVTGFVDPDMAYEQVLKFERFEGNWRLSGWPNYLEFERRFRANLEPTSTVRPFGCWEGQPE